MTRLMEQLIDALRALPEAEQDQFAEFILHELAEDERWTKTTEEHAEKLKRLIEDVMKDHAPTTSSHIDPAVIQARLDRLRASAGVISGPVLSDESLRRENMDDLDRV
jgi:hypothetical protein